MRHCWKRVTLVAAYMLGVFSYPVVLCAWGAEAKPSAVPTAVPPPKATAVATPAKSSQPASQNAAAADSAAKAKSPADKIGFKVRSFKLKDHRGTPIAMSRLADKKLLVVTFIGTECPLAKLYAPRLVALQKEYESKGVGFLAIDSNAQDDRTEIASFVKEHGIGFPFLRDVNNMIADHFGAERTPEVFLLDKDRVIRYRGQIDDQYGYQKGIGFERPDAVRRDLAEAINELLANKPVSKPYTQSTGCLIGRVRKPAAESKITYASHVAAIFNKRCVVCHRTGEVAPFSMQDFDEVVGWGEMIREVVNDGRMPPWHADAAHGNFSNDSRMSDEEKKIVSDWVAAGCPKGDESKIPAPPKFVKGWQINKPDEVYWAKPYTVPAEGTVDYQYFTVDPGFTEDRWVQAAEARAGNAAVVHHIIVFVLPPGSKRSAVSFDGFLVATAPGARPMVLAPGMAKRVSAGSKFLFQMHYTPNGTPQKDRSCVGLIFAKPESVTTSVKTTAALNLIFSIPPKADNHPVDAVHSLRRDSVLLSLYPHMHLRGKAFRYTARYPDGKEEVLLDIPRYDFNWQNTYELAEPKLLPKGTEIRCAAHFDNSPGNAANPDPNKTVKFGEQTHEEMMIGFFDIATPRDDEKDAKQLAAGRGRKKSASSKRTGSRAAKLTAKPGNSPSLATGS